MTRADPFDEMVERAFPTVQDDKIIGTTRRKRFACNLMNIRMMLEGLVLQSSNAVKKKVLGAFLQPGPTSQGRKQAAMTTFVKEVMNPGGLTRYSILLLIFSQPTLLKILRICSDQRNYPLLFHCSSGKDRTGLVAALILSVCGLSDEEIFDDYEKSERYLAPCMHLIQMEDRSKGLDPEFDGTPRHVIKRTFKWIRKVWGSVGRYLHHIGFTHSEQDRLHNLLTRSGGFSNRPRSIGASEKRLFGSEPQARLVNGQDGRTSFGHQRSRSVPKIDLKTTHDQDCASCTNADGKQAADSGDSSSSADPVYASDSSQQAA